MKQFWSSHFHTQALVMAWIAAWDNRDKILSLLREIVGEPLVFRFVQDKWDSFFIAEFTEVTWISFSGTRSNWAWASDAMAWWKNGFHYGITNSMDHLFVPLIKFINRDKPVRIAGQSRGGADALYANLKLRSKGFVDVESDNFSGPFIAAPTGYYQLAKAKVRHTNLVRDKYQDIGNQREALPSDPTDDVGVFRGRHYGTTINIGGSEGPFSHGYYSILNAFVTMILTWAEKDHIWIDDALFLANIRGRVCKK